VTSDASGSELDNPRTLDTEQLRALAGAMLAALDDDAISCLDALAWRRTLSER
jgi:hypothetical protein